MAWNDEELDKLHRRCELCHLVYFNRDVNDVTDYTISDDIIDLIDVANEVATVVVHNQVPTAYTSDGSTAQTTSLASYITDNTWFLLEIVISATDVKFYIDDTLRATHSTNVPSAVWFFAFGATCENNTVQKTYVQYVQIWGE